MKKCPKHCWEQIKASHIPEVKFYPGAMNYYFGIIELEICSRCRRIRNMGTKRK